MTNKILNAIPDILLFSSIPIAFILDKYLPLTNIIPSPLNLFGWLLVTVGIILGFYTINLLKSHSTSTNASQAPSKLLTSGPFSKSRNPFYLAYLIIITGITILFGSLSVLVLPVFVFVILNNIVIPLEEKITLQAFGDKYIQYKKSTRRWL